MRKQPAPTVPGGSTSIKYNFMPETAYPQKALQEAFPEPKVNVLLVDDQPANLLSLEAILQDPELNLIKALSGEEALRRLLVDDFAVILLDVQMQGLDGYETAKLIRGREKSRHTPIIFLTAYEDNRLPVDEAYALGAVDYLVKPLIPVILRAKVAGFVELFQKTEQVRRQAEQLRQIERRDFEHRLAEENARLRAQQRALEESEQRYRQLAETLREADRRKDEFLAMLAHELRNPLAPIRNAVQIMRLVGSADSELERSREMIDRQVEHMTRLVDDLLEVSRITGGKIKLQKQTVDLLAVAAQAVETSRPLIDARQHELTLCLPPEPILLDADPTRLAQVISNLLNNAAKYTEIGGHIWLTVSRQDGEAVVRVRDNGIGMPADLLPHVFDLFTQAERSLDRSQGGLGIGLTLARSLVTLHGGHISAHSEGPGKGSEFVVRLPELIEAKANAKDQMIGEQPAARHFSRRVLVVDDNRDAAESIAMLLRLWGHDVRTALDGRSALEAAQTYRPDVVLLDIGLPNVDGYEVAKQLRHQLGDNGLLLVAVTGYGQTEDRRRSAEAGFNRHLVKPVNPAELEALFGPAASVSSPDSSSG
jgi:signal transduction histidine kinase